MKSLKIMLWIQKSIVFIPKSHRLISSDCDFEIMKHFDHKKRLIDLGITRDSGNPITIISIDLS